MKLRRIIFPLIIMSGLHAQAQWECGDVPTDEQLRGPRGDEIVRIISRDCETEAGKADRISEQYTALLAAMDSLDKDSKFIDQYYAAAQKVADLTRWNQQLTIEISKYSGKLEEEIEKLDQWKQRAKKLNSEAGDAVRLLSASVNLPANHPLLVIKEISEFQGSRDVKAIASNYLRKVPNVFFTGERTGERELFSAASQVEQALILAENRTQKKANAFVKDATSLGGAMAEDAQVRLTYSKFKDKARIAETLKAYRIQSLQGVYLTFQSDLKTQIKGLKAFENNLGTKAKDVEAEFQRDLAALEAALTQVEKADSRQSYTMLKATLKVQAAGFEKKESEVLKVVAKKMRSWLAEADVKSGLAMQLKGEILYLESMNALKVESGRK